MNPNEVPHRFSTWLGNRSNRQRLMLFVLFLLFGIIVTNHVRSIQANFQSSDLTTRFREAQQELTRAEEANQQLVLENEMLQRQRDSAIDTMLSQEGNEDLLEEIGRIRVLAGFTEVRGRGITVTLDDKPGYDPLRDPVASIIHDGNVRHVVNLMVNNGAAAVSINGMRLVNSSYIYCIGPTILCNRERMTPPYVISAIGPSDILYSAVNEDQVLNQLKIPEIGVIIETVEKEDILIPPFSESDNFEQYINLLEVVNP